MTAILRVLDTGETMIFDKQTRDLFIIPAGTPVKNLDEARKLHAGGKSAKFDKAQLATIQAATANIVLLGGDPGT